MTGYELKRAAARDKLNDDDDIQVYKRPWVDLTDEEMQDCLNGLPTQTIDVYARRIEAKLKERNA